MKYFYHYTAGCYGTDIYGIKEANSTEEVYKYLRPIVLEHIELHNNKGIKVRLAIFAKIYEPTKHDVYLI